MRKEHQMNRTHKNPADVFGWDLLPLWDGKGGADAEEVRCHKCYHLDSNHKGNKNACEKYVPMDELDSRYYPSKSWLLVGGKAR